MPLILGKASTAVDWFDNSRYHALAQHWVPSVQTGKLHLIAGLSEHLHPRQMPSTGTLRLITSSSSISRMPES